uniref:Uncharacterized protein n=1 Tax=Kryptolebias marmoratus TaxID=37003 RepID=A0A3Q3AIS4_KRYMA
CFTLSAAISLLLIKSHLCREKGREEGKRNKNNTGIMRISKKFLKGVFNFNHQDYPSSGALISPLLTLPPILPS